MDEETIRLFASRAERLTQADDSEALREVIEKGIEQVPVVGPITTFILSRFWVPSAQERLETWLREFADDFERHCEKCSAEELVRNEVFVSASIQIARAVVSTHQEDKRRYLRNALLNIAFKREPSEEYRQIFMNAIEAFSVSHVKVLNVIVNGVRDLNDKGLWQPSEPHGIHNYGRAIGTLCPELNGEEDLMRYIIADLRNWGMTPMSGPADPFPLGGSQAVTNMGIRFHRFVLVSDDSPKRTDS